MQKFKVKIIETFITEVEIEAENKHDACNKAERLWYDNAFDRESYAADHEIYVED